MVTRAHKKVMLGFAVSLALGLGMLAALGDISPLLDADEWRLLYAAPGVAIP